MAYKFKVERWNMNRYEVAVTGMGAITPLGSNVSDFWSRLNQGHSGVASIANRVDGSEGLPVKIAGMMWEDPADLMSAPESKRLDRSQQAALVAAREAWADAGEPEIEPLRLAVVIGTGVGGISTILSEDDKLERQGARRVSPRTVPMLMANGAASLVSIEMGAKAGVYTPVSACASGAEALALGATLIRAGEADMVIAGGAEAAVVPLTIAAFSQIGALSKSSADPETVSRPFDSNRDGFVIGEGAGIVVLERSDHAKARGAKVHAYLSGSGICSDAFHITSPEPGGAGQKQSMTKALKQARLEPSAVGYVNCHATGTTVGDLAEAKSIQAVFGPGMTATAPKSALGHLVGAAGAVEAIISILSIRDGVIPPTLNLESLDPEIGLDVVTGSQRFKNIDAVISNSFGFGGQNVSLLFSK